MVSEKINFKFDIEKIQDHFFTHVLNKEFTRQSAAFGGWSVLSSNGEISDGWQRGHLLLDPNTPPELREKIKNSLTREFSEYKIETEICVGYLKMLIDVIRSHKLSPYRARIICLTAGHSSVWHRDATNNQYAVRLHVPIITNPGCFFETRNESEHLKADGSAYFLYVNREHRVTNEGSSDRYHLVMDVVDQNQVTQFHRKEDFYSKHIRNP